jgi:hypothetical protein
MAIEPNEGKSRLVPGGCHEDVDIFAYLTVGQR